MKTTTGMIAFCAASVLLAGKAGASDPVAAVSSEVLLDTSSLSAVAVVDDQELDTRSFTTDWSAAHRLNTKKIVGTAMLIR